MIVFRTWTYHTFAVRLLEVYEWIVTKIQTTRQCFFTFLNTIIIQHRCRRPSLRKINKQSTDGATVNVKHILLGQKKKTCIKTYVAMYLS